MRNSDLLLDEIDAGQFFGDGMLDLDPGIDFHEVEIALFIEKKFDGADRMVLRGPDDFDGASPIFLRRAGVRMGLGASSISFWRRRWIVQSRSPR